MILFLRALLALLLLLIVVGVFWALTAPQRLPAEALAALPEGDPARGERWFWAGNCASCHAAERASGDDRFLLAGGHALDTDFGRFVAPNISQHPEDGIGGWSRDDFANAMLRGVSPGGAHYYPAFPYTSYARMAPGDVADLWAFLRTLPAVEGRAADHDLHFPFTIRRGLGLWKRLHLDPSFILATDETDPELVHGRYLVEAVGHCGECHTPRDITGGSDTSRWLAGAPAATGDGTIPNITPGEGGIPNWSAGDLAYFFETGFTPDFDVVGGSMASVQRNLEMLTDDDRAAIAAYLKAVPPHPSEN
jgi:mono/diheme cytochrome c family protein